MKRRVGWRIVVGAAAVAAGLLVRVWLGDGYGLALTAALVLWVVLAGAEWERRWLATAGVAIAATVVLAVGIGLATT